MIRNRSYHARARRGGLVSAGEILDELARAADRQRFYRPARRPKPGAKAIPSLQLELDFAQQEPVPRDADRPLLDLLPEAYEGL